MSISPTAPTETSDAPALEAPGRGSWFSRLLNAAVLPKEVSAFEASYLRRMNRIALWFFYAHLPAFMVVAWANETGVLSVALMTAAVLAIPTLGCRAMESERSKSYVFAFTSMCMGGVLVHAGQGPVQIEMHFYFFSILAMLALFANPMTVMVGAATVAVHHLALWSLAPASVFNYDAPLWVVLVHAGFVVLETFAAGFIARNFFDNVIGLEKKVEQRTAQLRARNHEMQLVLDSIEQGIVTIDASGALLAEHSSMIVDFFGEYEPGESFGDYLSRSCVTSAAWFTMNWDALMEDFLPLELAIDQLPGSAKILGRSFTFDYKPKLDEDGKLEAMMIVVSEVTKEVERERAEALQRELLTMLECAISDPRGFAAFHGEASALLVEIAAASHGQYTPSERRALHTMKGNAAAFGLDSIAGLCHRVEDAWGEDDSVAARAALEALQERWSDLGTTAAQLLGPLTSDVISVTTAELEEMLDAAIEADAVDLARLLSESLLEPVSPVLARLETQAQQIAARLERDALKTDFEDNGVRVPAGAFDTFWSALVHVIRNAIDHGIERPEEREESAKDRSGQLSVAAEVIDDALVVTVEDDGRGVDWDRVREKAQGSGLPHETTEELTRALFASEFTTRDEVTELSGRGLGLSAIAAVIDNLRGSITVSSRPSQGTQMRFVIPLERLSTTQI